MSIAETAYCSGGTPNVPLFPAPIIAQRAPTSSDYGNTFKYGQLWVDQPNNNAYILTSVTAGAANWELFASGSGEISSLTGDSGTATPVAGVVQIAGGTNMTTSAATNVVTIDLDTTLTGLTSVTSDTFVTGSATAGVTYTANTITGTGSDAAISLNLVPKGAGITESSRAVVAGNNTLAVLNTDNTNSASGALLEASVGGTSAGDPKTSYIVTGGATWSVGADNSVTGDPLVIAANASLGTGNVMSINTTGEITKPLNPAFLSYLASTATNKTGNGATYTLGTDALTEVYDRGNNASTAGVFTAPVTGIYDLRAQITVTGATIATTFVIALVTTARTYQKTFIKAAGSQDESIDISALCDMTATDTAHVNITVSGEAGDTDDILGGATLSTFFCGTLVA